MPQVLAHRLNIHFVADCRPNIVQTTQRITDIFQRLLLDYKSTRPPERTSKHLFLHVVQIRVRLLGQILRIVVHMRNQLVPALLGCHFKKKRTWLGGFLRSSRRCCRSSSTVNVETMASYLLTLQPFDHVLSSLHFTIVPAPSQHHPRKVQLIFGTLTGHCVQVILHLVNVVRYNVEHRLHSRELGLNESRCRIRLSQLREDPVLRAPSSKKTEMQPLR